MSWVVALAVLAGCRVEGARQAAPPGQSEPTGDSAASAAARPAGHGVFSRRREVVAPGVVRLTLNAVVSLREGQDSARRVIERLVTEEQGRDTAVAAIRLLAYLPPAAGHGQRQSPLVPLAFADWAPAAGWDSLTPATARGPHRLTTIFMHDAATMRAMGVDPNAALPAPGMPPRGAQPALPRGHPAPGAPR